MIISTLKETHPFIYETALKRQVEQGNKADDSLGIATDSCFGGFYWAKSLERGYIWYEVTNGNFQSFYDFHQMVNPETATENTEGKSIPAFSEWLTKKLPELYSQFEKENPNIY